MREGRREGEVYSLTCKSASPQWPSHVCVCMQMFNNQERGGGRDKRREDLFLQGTCMQIVIITQIE